MTGFWYLATPYSKYGDGPEAAFVEAAKIVGSLIGSGMAVYSPIAHTHPVAIHSGMDPLDHNIWLPADKPMMDAAIGLIVAKMLGWEDSYGIGEEIKAFRAADKPIMYLECKDDNL